MKSKNNKQALFNDSPIHMGDWLRVEFDTDLLRWVMVNDVAGPASVQATILETANARYKQGRYMVISLKYVREHRSKDNPPPLLRELVRGEAVVRSLSAFFPGRGAGRCYLWTVITTSGRESRKTFCWTISVSGKLVAIHRLALQG